MSKKPKSLLNDLGDIKKPERTEPENRNRPNRGRGRPAERTPYVQLNTRIRLEVSEQIDAIADKNGWTIREVIENAIALIHTK